MSAKIDNIRSSEESSRDQKLENIIPPRNIGSLLFDPEIQSEIQSEIPTDKMKSEGG